MTKRIAIAELEGVALDWAAGKAAGKEISLTMAFFSGCRGGMVPWDDAARKPYAPTRDWRQCGPLLDRLMESGRWSMSPDGDDGVCISNVDRECIPIDTENPERWMDEIMHIGGPIKIAVCRAIVAAHNPSGFVEVPDELVED